MKPNWKDYLIATGEFIIFLLIAVCIMALILLTIFVLATYKVVAISLGLAALAGFVIYFVVGMIHILATSHASYRLDKDDEM